MSQWKYISSGIMLILLIGVGVRVVSTPHSEKKEGVTIGFVGPLTGDAASIGIANKAAVQFAIHEINTRGGLNGHPITLIAEDGKCNPKESTIVGKKLIEVDRVQYIIGGICSSETLALAPLAEQAQVILFSPTSSNPDITHAGEYIFRNYPSDVYQGIFAARYLSETLGITRVSVIAAQNDYAQGVQKEFEKEFTRLNGTIISSDMIAPDETNFQTVLAKIKEKQPHTIYAATAVVSQALLLIQQARQLGMTTSFFGVENWDDPHLLTESNITEGVSFAAIATPEAPDTLTQGIQSICPTCTNMPGVLQSYDAVQILTQAITQAKDDGEKVKDFLSSSSYHGLSGLIEFDHNGDLKHAGYVVKKILNGKIEKITSR